MEDYLVPTIASEAEFVEKRSRFLGQVFPVECEEQARERLDAIRKQHYNATHNCWCYRLHAGGAERYSDDGEPQGTAGQPMLNVFQREQVTNVLCVVTRYFGGILLGAGGLVRAYSQGAKLALDAAGVSVMRLWTCVDIPCPYHLLERIKLAAAGRGGVISDVEYGADVLLHTMFPAPETAPFLGELTDLSNGKVQGIVTGQTRRAFPVEP